MAAKRLFQRSQVMPVLGRADGDLLVRNDDDIADPVGRKLETPHSLVTADHQHDAVDGVQPGHDFADIASLRKIGGGERPQRAMMHDIGVGDRQDHPRGGLAEPFVQKVLNIDDGRVAGGVMFRLHAVVSRQHDGGSHLVELAEIPVDHGVEAERAVLVGRELVLDIVGGRQIQHIRVPFFQDLHTGGEDELRQLRGIDFRHRSAEPCAGILDAVFRLCRLIGALGRKTDGAVLVEGQAGSQKGAQLVLGGHERDPRPGGVIMREDGRRAKKAHIVHHHFLAGLRLIQVVAADAVNGGWPAGGDRHVVRVGE